MAKLVKKNQHLFDYSRYLYNVALKSHFKKVAFWKSRQKGLKIIQDIYMNLFKLSKSI